MGEAVFLGSPAFRGMRGDVAAAFYRHASRKRNLVVRCGASSLLTQSFNALWCAALNARRTEPIGYFAMLHDDIAPESWWLDTLIDELDATGLDVLSVAVPIKDARGLLSCGLSEPGDEYRFRPTGRFSLKELARMPATFTAESIGHAGKVLLVNTGCWVCRFDDWAKDVCFTINDGIGQTEDGEFVPLVEPEDWNFSRQLHAKGLRVGVTKKVRVSHIGDFSYRNDAVWGEPFDSTGDGPLYGGNPC